MTNTTTSTVLSPGVPVAGQVRVQYEAGSFLAFFDELGQCLGRKPWAETGIPDDADYVAFLLARYGTLATAKRVLIDGDQDADPEVIERRNTRPSKRRQAPGKRAGRATAPIARAQAAPTPRPRAGSRRTTRNARHASRKPSARAAARNTR